MSEYYAGATLKTIKSKVTRLANSTGKRVSAWVKHNGRGYRIGVDDYYTPHTNPYQRGVPVMHIVAWSGMRAHVCPYTINGQCTHA